MTPVAKVVRLAVAPDQEQVLDRALQVAASKFEEEPGTMVWRHFVTDRQERLILEVFRDADAVAMHDASTDVVVLRAALEASAALVTVETFTAIPVPQTAAHSRAVSEGDHR
ncbi:MAG TPA: antibiotic biosynthesis monooxygenase [Naasia sp.]|jgi:quinol monooxygenase YgiN